MSNAVSQIISRIQSFLTLLNDFSPHLSDGEYNQKPLNFVKSLVEKLERQIYLEWFSRANITDRLNHPLPDESDMKDENEDRIKYELTKQDLDADIEMYMSIPHTDTYDDLSELK